MLCYAMLCVLRSEVTQFASRSQYGTPSTIKRAVQNAAKLAASWNMPALLTEYGGYGSGCDNQRAATAAGIGSSYWHFSDYCWPKHCPGGAPDGQCSLPDGPRWGACITGWGNGNTSFKCS